VKIELTRHISKAKILIKTNSEKSKH